MGGRRGRVAAGGSLGAPLDRAGRVTAEPTLAVPGHADIFVVGDICSLQQDGKVLAGVAQVAKQEGGHAAKNVLRAIRGEALEPFRYRNYGSMATIGRGSAVADIGPVQIVGARRLVHLAVHPHLLADWIPQSPRGARRMGVGVCNVSAAGASDHRRDVSGRAKRV